MFIGELHFQVEVLYFDRDGLRLIREALYADREGPYFDREGLCFDSKGPYCDRKDQYRGHFPHSALLLSCSMLMVSNPCWRKGRRRVGEHIF